MGFSKDMQRIIQIIDQYKCNDGPRRQTLLFSATIPPALRSIMESGLRKDHIQVDCVEDIDPTTHTNESVHQTFVTLPDPKDKMVRNDLYRLSPKMKKTNANNTLDVSQYRWISGLVDIIEDIIHVQNPTDYKIVVFFPTTAATQFFSYIFNNVYNISVIEMHSQKHQSNRTSCSKLFRNTKNGILFTTDVSGENIVFDSPTIPTQHRTKIAFAII
jgi:ATP-dependent RNA helicase MSS116